MKRVALITTAVIMTALIAPEASGGPLSVRIGVGALVRYNWWNPAWENGVRLAVPRADVPASIPYRVNRYETASAPLFGFTVMAQFLKTWSFSSSLLFGNFRSRSRSSGPNPPAALSILRYDRDIRQYDFEAHIGYQVSRYFGAYLCVKTRAYDFTEGIRDAIATGSASLAYKASAHGEHIDVGPGLGATITVPMPGYENIFLFFQGAGMILATSGSYTNDYQIEIYNGTLYFPVGQYDRESFYSWCGQGGLSLGYTLDPAGVTFMLGGRYEMLYYRHHRLIKGFLRYNGRYDHTYGMTFTVVYAVTLTGPDPVKM